MAGDDERHVFVGFKELVGIADVPCFVCVGERAFGQIGIRGLQRTTNGLETDAVAVELIGIGFNPNGGTRASPNEDLADTFDLSELLRQDGIGGVINLRRPKIVRSQRQNHDGGVRRIDLAVRGLAGKIGGKLIARGVDGGLHVASGSVDIAIEIKLKRDASGSEAAGGGHLRDTSNAAELALERSSNGRSHRFRAGTGQARANRNRREINLRQRSYR